MPLKESWLVQRLKIPWEPKAPTKPWRIDKEGKIDKAYIEKRQGVCEYDYMGSAEFEFDTIANGVKALIPDAGKLVPFTLKTTVNCDEIDFGKPIKAKIYGFCRKDDLPEVKKRVEQLLRDKLRLLERLYLTEAFKEKDGRVAGWWDITNGFYFFKDRTMWERMFFLYTGKKPY